MSIARWYVLSVRVGRAAVAAVGLHDLVVMLVVALLDHVDLLIAWHLEVYSLARLRRR